MNVFSAMVVRTVKRKEMLNTPAAKKAMDDEWNKLSKQVVWDLATVREQGDVAAQARNNNKNSFRRFLWHTKGRDFKEDDPAKKWKGRFVFRGSDVKDEYDDTANFQRYLHLRQRLRHPEQLMHTV